MSFKKKQNVGIIKNFINKSIVSIILDRNIQKFRHY